MKLYEGVTRTHLMPRGYACIRVDGRSFSQYTKGLAKPFDSGLMADMNATAVYLCENFSCQMPTADLAELTTRLDAMEKATR